MLDLNDIGRGLKEKISRVSGDNSQRSTGRIVYSGDGIIKIAGLSDVQYNELLDVRGGYHALALNLEHDSVGAVLFSGEDRVRFGDYVYSTGKAVEMKVGEEMLGRIVDPLGEALDGLGEIVTGKSRPVEFPAPAIMDRGKVDKPLQTGILAIDSMIPIGRGQRELIIGDRQTGKTAIAVDTILNQKGENVICIYVSIGQKASSLAKTVNTLRSGGAMDYTCVVCSTADDAVPLQYIAPYSGCALAEYFMYQGKDVLIVYDDLSKHAVAYRAMSLLLKRPAGREAYPGDVFYLHSRLLERAAKLSEEKGGGSITALPIVETLAGDISAYIPTNVISITDGQIYLESELFNSGVRPAVNVGLSVSRVGGSAQRKAIRQISGQLRINLAQYRELAIFMQFGSDLDSQTQKTLSRGAKLTDTLKQRQYLNYSVKEMIVLLVVSQSDLIDGVPAKKVTEFNDGLLDYLRINRSDLLGRIDPDAALTDELKADILAAAGEYMNMTLGDEGGSADV
ncbi:MAG TPA: F0F1 ATP synthase subunit alpha [Candidatus Borkfalkia stercoripullorum]|nr:F0F1 ATP synthase subunit alpha [Candidatus Borkfalkia stercoripullorum]